MKEPRIDMMILYIKDWDGYCNAMRVMNRIREGYARRDTSIYLYRMGI